MNINHHCFTDGSAVPLVNTGRGPSEKLIVRGGKRIHTVFLGQE